MSTVDIVSFLFTIFLAIGIHEYCHAKFADMAGDPTPRFYGRVTLNLFNHFDLFGAAMIVFSSILGVGFGWGRPVPMNPSKMRNPRWDHFVAVIAGPVSNIVQAMVWMMLLRLLGLVTTSPEILRLCLIGVIVNISLAAFNLVPLGPLDGMWLLGTFLNERARLTWTRYNLTYGSYLFLFLILFGNQLGPYNPLFLARNFFFDLILRLIPFKL
jgi:Zn-dependent protease